MGKLMVGVTRFVLIAFFMLVASSVFLTKPDETFAVGSDGVWVQVSNMLNSHCLGGTILLENGEVLVTTGYDGSSLTPTSELYDPLSQTWTTTGNVNQARHSWRKPIVTLNDGRAMLVGGADANVTSLASVELYDPISGTWSYTGSLNVPRRQPAVLKLQSGKVLVAAGANGAPDGNRFLSSSEIYDPATAQWTFSGNLHVAREVGNFVLLHDGRAMVAGGEGPWGVPGNTAEIYDPSTGQWTRTTPMLYGWFGGASMTVLNDGRVLVAGGWDGNMEHTTAMIYAPAANTWTYTGSMHYPHGDTAPLLSDGKVLAMGGGVNGKSAEVYNPSTGQWTLVGDMHQEFNTPHGVVTLPNGDIFVAGACIGTAEMFTTPLISDLELLAPFKNGTGFKISSGYYNVSLGGDHDRNQLFGLDLVPDDLSDTRILAPVGGKVDYVPYQTPQSGDCLGLVIGTGDQRVHLNVCHFAGTKENPGWNVHTGDTVPRGKVLGSRNPSKNWVHLNLDDRYGKGGFTYARPVPFTEPYTLEGAQLNPNHDGNGITVKLYEGTPFEMEFKVTPREWEGWSTTSSNIPIP